MEIIKKPPVSIWSSIIQRPYIDNSAVLKSVQQIIAKVKKEGDAALYDFAGQFDGSNITTLEVEKSLWQSAAEELGSELKEAIVIAKNNIGTFHRQQLQPEAKTEVMPGIRCWRRSVGIEKVGLYIPGGTAPLFSTVLMLGIPARLAGCKEVILCTPAGKNGKIHPAVLFAAHLVGISRIFATGGAQAIAAMAFGTETIPAVNKIFGPGNQYVTMAKQLVQMEGIAIDMPAGPSEVMVLCDDTAIPSFVAADLLSQAEHGPDSQVMLVSTSEEFIGQTLKEVYDQLELLPRKEIASVALENSKAVVMDSLEEAIAFANAYAAEHLIICCRDAENLSERIVNAGSVFIGNYSPESAGDYASGTNHTLPTNGYALAYSGVSVDSFVKKITFQQLTKEGLDNLSSTIITMAMAEGLEAHANAIRIRKTMES